MRIIDVVCDLTQVKLCTNQGKKKPKQTKTLNTFQISFLIRTSRSFLCNMTSLHMCRSVPIQNVRVRRSVCFASEHANMFGATADGCYG